MEEKSMKVRIEYKSEIIEQGSITLVHLKEDGTYSESTLPCDFTSLEQAQEKAEKNSLIKEFSPAQKKELDMGGYYDISPEDIQTFEDILSRARFKAKARRKTKLLGVEQAVEQAVEQLKSSTGEDDE